MLITAGSTEIICAIELRDKPATNDYIVRAGVKYVVINCIYHIDEDINYLNVKLHP